MNTIEQITNHIDELDKDLVSVFNGSPFERCQVHAALMQAKSTALVALAQAKANAMEDRPMFYSFGPDVEVESLDSAERIVPMTPSLSEIVAAEMKKISDRIKRTGPSGDL